MALKYQVERLISSHWNAQTLNLIPLCDDMFDEESTLMTVLKDIPFNDHLDSDNDLFSAEDDSSLESSGDDSDSDILPCKADIHLKQPKSTCSSSLFVKHKDVSQITKEEHLASVIAYAQKHCATYHAFADLLKLIQLHLPKNNACETSVSRSGAAFCEYIS